MANAPFRHRRGALNKKALAGIGGGFLLLLIIFSGGGEEAEPTKAVPTQNDAALIVEDVGDVLSDVVEETIAEEKTPQIAEPEPTPTPTSVVIEPGPTVATTPVTPTYTCNCKKTCTQITSCDEAYYQLINCGCSIRDGDDDGVPCESICPGG